MRRTIAVKYVIGHAGKKALTETAIFDATPTKAPRGILLKWELSPRGRMKIKGAPLCAYFTKDGRFLTENEAKATLRRIVPPWANEDIRTDSLKRRRKYLDGTQWMRNLTISAQKHGTKLRGSTPK